MGRASVMAEHRGRSAFTQDRQTVLIASDHALTRLGLATAASSSNLDVLGQAETLENTLTLVDQLNPDLLILDISLRNGMGIGLIKQCKAQSPRLKILVLSAHEEWLYAGRALQAGAQGYLSRFATAETVADGLRSVMKDQAYLSPELTRQIANGAVGVSADPMAALTDREQQVFESVGQGLTVRAIARRLKLSQHTVETYRERIKTKLNLKNGTDLSFRAIVWVLMHE